MIVITTLVDPRTAEANAVEDMLLAAGARSIVLSDAHVRDPGQRDYQMRGSRLADRFPQRVRVEALTDQASQAAVLQALRALGADPGNSLVYEVIAP